MQQEYTSIGILGKPHGTSGAFHFKLTANLHEDADLPEVLFLKLKDGILPFFVSDWSLKNDFQGTIAFEDITSREQGAGMVNAELMVKAAEFEQYFEEDIESHLLGYTVVDAGRGELGKIVEVTDNTVQDVAVVQYGGHQIMFPLVENFIEKEDSAAKVLHVRLPDGLIEAYTEHAQDEPDED